MASSVSDRRTCRISHHDAKVVSLPPNAKVHMQKVDEIEPTVACFALAHTLTFPG